MHGAEVAACVFEELLVPAMDAESFCGFVLGLRSALVGGDIEEQTVPTFC